MATHIGVLPADILQAIALGSPDGSLLPPTRFVRLLHPRTGLPCLFLPYNRPSQTTQILEMQGVSPINARSWTLGEEIISDGKLLILTPIDPAFLLIPILKFTLATDGTAGNFRPADDMFEDAISKLSVKSNDLISVADITSFVEMDCTRTALRRVCEMKEVASDIMVYRFSSTKVVDYVRKKVDHMSSFPVIEMSRSITRNLAKDGLLDDGREMLLAAAKTKIACDLICQYLPPLESASLVASYDFTDLNAFMKQLEEESLATTTKSGKGTQTPKETNGDKKRKNAKGSHGVEKLKKANVKGMAKLSTFFTKKAAA
ncbi:ribonuclease H2, subunit B [Desarmillaria tabescens]|uniref:Ribonuclease H2 subunit B n=1 Tax=Armillaria tabescens TaxID=1929756 RepID=A0AA39N915_ARMTA|nr:ribonuclease H2, subunit B [Desarmillaria tabescens]KAK0461281.1 ribonuclease H2, subunit B [Desarmillaria tabescens]